MLNIARRALVRWHAFGQLLGIGALGALLVAPPFAVITTMASPRTTLLAAPELRSPPTGTILDNMGPTLLWDLPVRATQYHLEVTPFNRDGPGISLIRTRDTSYTILPPVRGKGNYVLLPGITYMWHVRASDATTSIGENDPSWTSWSETWNFTTPTADSGSIRAFAPWTYGSEFGATVSNLSPTLVWADDNPAVFYYEVQLSQDKTFTTDLATATAAVYWNLVHGGQTRPLDSWALPRGTQLLPGMQYYWRVRPRIQGNGGPVQWSATFVFSTPHLLPGEVRVPAQPEPMFSYDILTNTGIHVNAGGSIIVSASGTWTVGVGYIGPDGDATQPCECPVQAPLGALIGRVGKDGAGPYFLVGSTATLTAPTTGDLWLGANDNTGECRRGEPGSCYVDNDGFLNVEIQVKSPALAFFDEFDGGNQISDHWCTRGEPVVGNGHLTITSAGPSRTEVRSCASFRYGSLEASIQASEWPVGRTDSSFGFEIWNNGCHYGAVFIADGHLGVLRSEPVAGYCSGDPVRQYYALLPNWDVIRASHTVYLTLTYSPGRIVLYMTDASSNSGLVVYSGEAVPDEWLNIRLNADYGETYRIDYVRLYQ